MATREEIADILAGFALFGDLQTPQLLGVAGTFEEVYFPQGERILRQGLTATGFYVIDFNRAYNPTCAYNPTWECPYPPAENRLKAAIRAGEKAPPEAPGAKASGA